MQTQSLSITAKFDVQTLGTGRKHIFYLPMTIIGPEHVNAV